MTNEEFSEAEYREARRAHRRRRVLPTFLVFASVYFGIRGCVSLMSDHFAGSEPGAESPAGSESGAADPD